MSKSTMIGKQHSGKSAEASGCVVVCSVCCVLSIAFLKRLRTAKGWIT
jgi:hypothetical protein